MDSFAYHHTSDEVKRKGGYRYDWRGLCNATRKELDNLAKRGPTQTEAQREAKLRRESGQ